jgi:hypothetical protein
MKIYYDINGVTTLNDYVPDGPRHGIDISFTTPCKNDLTYWAIDLYNNSAEHKTETYYVDIEEPETRLIEISDSTYQDPGTNILWISPSSTFRLQPVDYPRTSLDTQDICASGVAYTEYGYQYRDLVEIDPFEYVGLDGELIEFQIPEECRHRVFFRSTDNVNNVEYTKFIDVNVDGSAPIIPGPVATIVPDPNNKENCILEINVEAEDQGSTVYASKGDDPCIVGMKQIDYRIHVTGLRLMEDYEYLTDWITLDGGSLSELVILQDCSKRFNAKIRFNVTDLLGNERKYLLSLVIENRQIIDEDLWEIGKIRQLPVFDKIISERIFDFFVDLVDRILFDL